MAEYLPQILKEVQKTEVDMLETFVGICERNRIDYFAIYGTAIGCVRHKGFIPWDDDIDVGMLWDDYLKLRAVPKEEWGNSLVLCDPSDDNENHYFPYPRIYKLGTTMLPESFESVRDRTKNNTGVKYNGIWIDILIFHKFQNLEEVKTAKKQAMTLRKKYLYSKKEKIIGMEHGALRKLLAIGQNIFSRYTNYKSKAPEKEIWQEYMALFRDKGRLLTTVDYPYNNCPERTLLELDDVFPLRKVEFDRLIIKVPKEVEKNLQNIYGNYMELPSEEKRINHAPSYLDLGNGPVIG